MASLPEDRQFRGLRPPRFRLATLLWLVAVLCVVFAVMGAAGPRVALALVVLLLAIAAHVAGNAIGTQLRDGASRSAGGCRPAAPTVAQPDSLASAAAPSRLAQRHRLGPAVAAATVCGFVLGAAAGATLLVFATDGRITAVSLGFGAAFAGLLGGLSGFLASSFFRVMLAAYREAAAATDKQPGAALRVGTSAEQPDTSDRTVRLPAAGEGKGP